MVQTRSQLFQGETQNGGCYPKRLFLLININVNDSHWMGSILN